jgi:hypothetical protein
MLIFGEKAMQSRSTYLENPDRYEIATEVLSSAIRVLQAAGFQEDEIPKLFAQVAGKRKRVPLYLERLAD